MFNTIIWNTRRNTGTSTLSSLVLNFAPCSGGYSRKELLTIPRSRSLCSLYVASLSVAPTNHMLSAEAPTRVTDTII